MEASIRSTNADPNPRIPESPNARSAESGPRGSGIREYSEYSGMFGNIRQPWIRPTSILWEGGPHISTKIIKNNGFTYLSETTILSALTKGSPQSLFFGIIGFCSLEDVY